MTAVPVPVHRRLPSPLHAARAGIAACWFLAIALYGVLFEHPMLLVAALVAIASAALAAGASADLRRASMLALPIALLVALINPLVYREGTTVLLRAGEVLGRRFDVTLESTVFGAVAGLRVAVTVLALALLTACVDPDDLLRLFRRVSYRAALTGALAMRLVPVLARDARRRADAARCRPRPLPRAAVARAALTGAVDRAVDVAAALETRGYATPPRRPAPRPRTPWSRHDRRVALSAASLAALAGAAAITGVDWFDPYPRIRMALDPVAAATWVAVPVLALLPFAGAAARLGVARA